MYTRHFGLRKKPFKLHPDPRFLYLSEGHREAFAHLKYGVTEGMDFVVITGDVGIGKTTLLKALLEELDPSIKRVHLSDPGSTAGDLFYLIKQSLDLPVQNISKGEMLCALNDFMSNKLSKDESVLLIIDEAQCLSAAMLEEIRLLSNIEDPDKHLFQIFLLGQQELNVKLQAPELRHLRQRIAVKYHLRPLSSVEDTQGYIMHRLQVAGLQARPFRGLELFSPGAIKAIYKLSKGYPRLINIICDSALVAAYAKDASIVTRKIIDEVTRDMEASYEIRQKRIPRKLAWLTGLILLLGAFTYGISRHPGIFQIYLQEMPFAKEISRMFESNGEDTVDRSYETVDRLYEEVFFGFGSFRIQPEAVGTLKGVAEAIERFPEAQILIEGHSDNVGDEQRNRMMSERRAEAVKQWLMDHTSVEASRFTVKGWGSRKPKYSNDSYEGRRKNRRVEITLRARSRTDSTLSAEPFPSHPKDNGQGNKENNLW